MSSGPSPKSQRRPYRAHWIVGAALAAVVAGLVVVATWGTPGSGPSTPAGCERIWQASPATATPVKHLFVIVKENHAFENYFGTLPGVAGDPPNGSFPVAFNSSTVVQPFPLTGYSTPDLPHDAASDLTDFNGGLDNLFVAQANATGATDPTNAVGYYTERQIPDYFAYARNYTVGDHFFTGVLGPTNPNRVFDLSAYVGSWNADTSPPADVTAQPTVLGQLTDADLPWAYDYEGLPLVLAPYWFPALTSDPCSSSRINAVEGLAAQLSGPAPPSVVFIDPSDSLSVSEHPPQNITVGEEWTVSTVNTILKSPVGSSSAILIFFDENGGFWDPVPPPMTSTGRDGFRVPFIVISPWTPAGKVCHSTVDSASVLSFIDANWGLPFLTPRVASAGNLSCFFDFSQAPRAPILLPGGAFPGGSTGGGAPAGPPAGFWGGRPFAPLPGGGGQLTVVRAGNGRPLRKVPSPGNAGSGGSPTGESPSSGAETTQLDGTVMVPHRRLHRDMMKRPTPREQALTDGMRSFPDRRGERAVECCLKRKGAYYHDLAGTSVR